MQNIITGKAYVLGDNVDTDQIIPAQYLAYNPSIPEERKFFGMYALSSVPEGQAGLPAGNGAVSAAIRLEVTRVAARVAAMNKRM